MYQGQTYNSKCNPYRLTNETLGFSWDGHAYSMHTQQNSLIGSIPKIKFFHWLRQCHQYFGPYTIYPNKILTTCAPCTYMHVMHRTFYGRTLNCTRFEIVYEEKEECQNKSMPIF